MNLERRAFVVASREMTVRDVLAYRHVAELDAGPAAIAVEHLRARTLAERWGEIVPVAALQRALDDLRAARGLLAADDFATWLAWHGLELDRVAAHLAGELHAAVLRDRAKDTAVHPSAARAAIAIATICAGALAPLAERVARRVRAGLGREDPTARQDRLAELRSKHGLGQRADTERLAELLGVPPPAIEWMLYVEAGFRAREARVVTSEAIARELGARPFEYAAVGWRVARFTDEATAREAALCARDDRASLETLARMVGGEAWTERALVGELGDGVVGPRLRSAAPDEVIGPLADGPTWLVLQVRARAAASPDSTAASRLAGERVLAQDLAAAKELPEVTHDEVEYRR